MNRNRARFAPHFRDGPQPAARACDHPGCEAAGEYRAPKDRERLNDYYWFCLDHVREYNKSWDYYAGLSEKEIEEAIRRDTTWQRPTWPLGDWRAREERMREKVMRDFGMGGGRRGAEAEAEFSRRRMRTPEEEALDVLELAPPVDFPVIKARYRELAKIHHPDANGGDPAAEEKIKKINQAYNILKASYGM
ncbi:MAG TPA: J domain-containing protein [Azospirillaceae bacterium]|nr:J domain-containing protein [Azospirillaceae bacterium]